MQKLLYGNIVVSLKHPETLCQSYQAGLLLAMVESYYPDLELPALPVCMVNFHSLRELFGERLWQKLKASSRFGNRVRLYEALAYTPHRPREILGTSRDFCLGYSKSYVKSRRKKLSDRKQRDAAMQIFSFLRGTDGNGSLSSDKTNE